MRRLILTALFAIIGAVHMPADAVVKCACKPTLAGPAK